MNQSTSTSNKYKLIENLLANCLLPELKHELGSIQLSIHDFDNFRKEVLSVNLPILFDGLQQEIEAIANDNLIELQSIKVNFVLLVCEQTAFAAPFQIDIAIVLNNLHKLIDQWIVKVIQSDRAVIRLIFEYYKGKLKSDTWRFNIGAVYGYCRFCQIYFLHNGYSLKLNDSLFTLSVGILLMELYDPNYKTMGLDLFKIIFSNSDKDQILDMNIAEAIYSICHSNIEKCNDEIFSMKLWSCIIQCFDYDKNWQRNVSKWNKLDDILDKLLVRIVFESNQNLAINYIFILTKCSSLPFRNEENICRCTDFNEIDIISSKEIKNLKEFVVDNKNLTTWRWTKKILKLFVHFQLFGSSDVVLHKLKALHILYIICILPIPVGLMGTHFYEFLKKFTENLVEASTVNKSEVDIIKEILQIIETMMQHIDNHKNKLGDFKEKCADRYILLDKTKEIIIAADEIVTSSLDSK